MKHKKPDLPPKLSGTCGEVVEIEESDQETNDMPPRSLNQSWVWSHPKDSENQSEAICQGLIKGGKVCGKTLKKEKSGSTKSFHQHLHTIHHLADPTLTKKAKMKYMDLKKWSKSGTLQPKLIYMCAVNNQFQLTHLKFILNPNRLSRNVIFLNRNPYPLLKMCGRFRMLLPSWHFLICNFFFLAGVHSSKRFSELFHSALKKYLAVDCLHTITADNASVNSKMACKLELQIPHFDSATHILGCVAHIINLAAKPDLYAKEIRCLKMDVTTRWNSTYEMFWQALMLQKSCTHLCQQNLEASAYILSPAEWNHTQGIMKLLEPHSEATNVLCASKYPTLNNVLLVYIVLLDNLHTARRGLYDQAQLIQPAQLMIKKIDEYLQDTVKKPVYIAAMILDPRFKTLFWKTHQYFITEHYHLYWMHHQANTKGIQSEIKQYLKEDIKSAEIKLMPYWATQQKTLPNLALIAHRYLCIPATSASSERVFSKGHHIISWQKSSLKPQTI
ncbi:uncharacterized protein VP01_1916g4 [Puccinia sorghi]|uniref:HAT C-terminal dimerisation domain-containing protein n=1 Tax=Puccinia sorghi TaxID=27349 RepID=A0A0L6VD81_9BASI|nr:uncharacterized protein VP01_1916g4 [Puccinia sorghi]